MMLHIRQHIFHDYKRFYQHLLRGWVRHCTEHASAGIIIIGNEILKARVKDTNSHYACGMLYNCGVKVEKISVISDDVEEIKQEIRIFSKKYTHIITAGGIGPTHDDVTYDGLAEAFNDSLHYHPKLVDIIKNQFGVEDSTSPIFKMAYSEVRKCLINVGLKVKPFNIPVKSSLIFGKSSKVKYPCVALENVYIFPGSPEFFEKSFGNLCKELFSTNRLFAKDEIYLNAREDSFANILTILTKEFPNVSFGSYPVRDNRYYRAFITIESDNVEQTKKAKEKLCALIGSNVLVEYDNNPHVDSLTKYHNFLKKCPRPFIYEETLEKLTNIYHEREKVAIYVDSNIESFIVVHLAHLVRTRLHVDDKLRVIHFKSSKLFRHTEEIISDTIKRYDINISSLEDNLSCTLNESRSSELPFGTLLVGIERTRFNEATSCLTRINEVTKQLKIIYPLENWTKEDIWIFGRFLSLPFR